jgi:hypothetical protein
VLVHPGTVHRELVALESGKWTAPEIVNRSIAINRRFQPVSSRSMWRRDDGAIAPVASVADV